jgi:hypothetical protein
MSSSTFSFPVRLARRFPDPVFEASHGINRYVFFVPVRAVPKNIPSDPNARIPNVNRLVYRQVEQSLLDKDGEAGTFHLKHKGITVVANHVERRSNDYLVEILKGQGILDGGHTYQLLTKDRDEDELPEDQFVKFEILTGIPEDWIPEIAGGLNSSVQVQAMSLDNLAGKFEWIKEEIKDQDYAGSIAWRENEDGDFDARDIVSILTCFNIDLFPNDGDQHPVAAYEKKSACLKLFEKNPETYESLSPILTDILHLHDTIRFESRKLWNESGGQFGKLAFVEKRERGEFTFPFTGESGQYRLTSGALFPILAAFRWRVEKDPKRGVARWRGGFKQVLKRWEESGEELLKYVAQTSSELGRNPNAVGKSRNLWANLHARLAMRDLMAKDKKSA